jgi:capsular polysaccharide transport system permease protein
VDEQTAMDLDKKKQEPSKREIEAARSPTAIANWLGPFSHASAIARDLARTQVVGQATAIARDLARSQTVGQATAIARELARSTERIAGEAVRALEGPDRKFSPILLSFIGLVVAPAFAVVLYFAFIASDQFAAETRFAVRSWGGDQGDSGSSSTSAGESSNPTSSLSMAFSTSGQNAYIVTSYIRSRAIVDDLNKKINLRKIFTRPEADFWARLKRNASIDELAYYWKSMVDTYVETLSGIVTVKLRAFRREDALALAKAINEVCETLVNRMSDRARRDAMAMSEKEMRRSYAAVQAALEELHKFRDEAGIIDPRTTTDEIGKLLIPLLTNKIQLESELFVATREMNAEAPTVRVLTSQLETVEKQISTLKGKLTGTKSGAQTVAASLAKFEELEIQRQLAEGQYAMAQASLNKAQLRANRQNVYLTVFVPPSLPEEARYPRRIAFPVLITIALGILWAIAMMILASVEDHRL